ncbi:hypothetical protein [Hyalangium gracile]|uniref:hypothetical protein n=1 Tax=Hyalangium gracile TaxID=394092 RepID=UPI001CCE85BB|nr:hypothetical protein [Hyalangium gracile]
MNTRRVLEEGREYWQVDAFDWVDGYLAEEKAQSLTEALEVHGRLVQQHQVPGHAPEEMELETEEQQRQMRQEFAALRKARRARSRKPGVKK